MSLYNNLSDNLAKASLPGTVVGVESLGYSLPDIVQLITLVWLGVIIVDKLWDMYRKWRKDRYGDKGE